MGYENIDMKISIYDPIVFQNWVLDTSTSLVDEVFKRKYLWIKLDKNGTFA